MRSSKRLERIPPYLFAELERKVAARRAAGADVISLGIGDPDTPTFPEIVAAAQRAVADPSTHTYPTNRGRLEFRQAVADFYARRFGVELDPETEVMDTVVTVPFRLWLSVAPLAASARAKPSETAAFARVAAGFMSGSRRLRRPLHQRLAALSIRGERIGMGRECARRPPADRAVRACMGPPRVSDLRR